ncbi:MAG: hypothetical protein ABEJ95_01410 [Candidatus Nanohalobium sp.]
MKDRFPRRSSILPKEHLKRNTGRYRHENMKLLIDADLPNSTVKPFRERNNMV